MAYLDDELSVSDGSRADLVEFIGPVTTWRYTSAPTAISYGGNSYQPIAGLTRTGTGAGGGDAASLTIALPISSAVVAAYGFADPPRSLRLRLHLWQERSGEARTVWEGDVKGIAPRGHMAQLRSESLVGSRMASNVPGLAIQPQCQHFLYDARCRVDAATYAYVQTVAAVDGDEVTISTIGAYVDDWFKAGEIVRSLDGERRTIVANAGPVLSLLGRFGALDVGDTVTLYAGCDHRLLSHCLNKFNNVQNFSGHPTIPDSNPFDVPLSRLKR